MVRSQFDQLEASSTANFTLPLTEAHVDLSLDQPIADTELQPVAKVSSPRWLLFGLSICCALGTIAACTFLWLVSLPPAINCKNVSSISPDVEQLTCAQEAARSGSLSDLTNSLKLVEHWSPSHPLYHQAQQWMAEWSQSVLVAAQQAMIQGNFKQAIKIANRIPKSSPVYVEAQASITQWKQRWKQGATLYTEAQAALKRQDWERVSQRMQALHEVEFDYWRSQKVKTLAQQVLAEKQAQRTLAKAEQLAQAASAKDLRAAITLANTIDAKTYVHAKAQHLQEQWGEALLAIGFQKWQERQLDEAITLAEAVALNPKLNPEATRLINLSQARKLMFASGSNWQVNLGHIWNMAAAVTIAHQIPPKSRFYAQAQTSLKSWEAQLQNIVQLGSAQAIASLGQRYSLEMAIAQAQQISVQEPRRLQAQTLISHWTGEIERLEDRPTLLQAQKLAEPGTVPALRAAIAEAGKVAPGRVLRGEAQGLIYGWTRQIEIFADRPLLNLARVLADQGQLNKAIQAAMVIRPGRALYWQAQAAINDWQSELQRIEAAQAQAKLEKESSEKATIAPANSEVNHSDQAEQTAESNQPEPSPPPTATVFPHEPSGATSTGNQPIQKFPSSNLATPSQSLQESSPSIQDIPGSIIELPKPIPTTGVPAASELPASAPMTAADGVSSSSEPTPPKY